MVGGRNFVERCALTSDGAACAFYLSLITHILWLITVLAAHSARGELSSGHGNDELKMYVIMSMSSSRKLPQWQWVPESNQAKKFPIYLFLEDKCNVLGMTECHA